MRRSSSHSSPGSRTSGHSMGRRSTAPLRVFVDAREDLSVHHRFDPMPQSPVQGGNAEPIRNSGHVADPRLVLHRRRHAAHEVVGRAADRRRPGDLETLRVLAEPGRHDRHFVGIDPDDVGVVAILDLDNDPPHVAEERGAPSGSRRGIGVLSRTCRTSSPGLRSRPLPAKRP